MWSCASKLMAPCKSSGFMCGKSSSLTTTFWLETPTVTERALERMRVPELPDLGGQQIVVGDLPIDDDPGRQPMISDVLQDVAPTGAGELDGLDGPAVYVDSDGPRPPEPPETPHLRLAPGPDAKDPCMPAAINALPGDVPERAHLRISPHGGLALDAGVGPEDDPGTDPSPSTLPPHRRRSKSQPPPPRPGPQQNQDPGNSGSPLWHQDAPQPRHATTQPPPIVATPER